MFVRLDPIILFVKDFDRQLAFYKDTLGLKYKGGSYGWAEFDIGGTTFALHGGFKGHVPKDNNVAVHFTVKGINELTKQLKAKGVRFTKDVTLEDFGAFQATLEDPEGNEFDLIEEAPQVAKGTQEKSMDDHAKEVKKVASKGRPQRN